jgi:hypothetical protein
MASSVTIDVVHNETSKALDTKHQLETILFDNNSMKLTNKKTRLIKKFFNQLINLTDNMFKGFHSDGKIIGSMGDDETEINMLYSVLKKTPSISFAKAEKTIKKWIFETKIDDFGEKTYVSKKHELIIRAYDKYIQEIKDKKATVKTRGVDLVTKCWDYFNSTDVDVVIEEQINKASEELKSFISPSFDDTFTFEDFKNSLILVLDISGSMAGVPLNTGLFYMLMLVKIFSIQTLYFFETNLHIKNIETFDISNHELIKIIYTKCLGSTNLVSVFEYLDKNKINNKNVVVITDGDCDPINNYYTTDIKSPFHEVTCIDKKNSKYPDVLDCNFIVVNVKNTEMNFPYLGIDPKVCYLTGNNPKTLNGFIKALCESSKTKTMITPELVLKYTLTMDELVFNHTVPKYSSVMTDGRINELFNVFIKNLPPAPKAPITEDF